VWLLFGVMLILGCGANYTPPLVASLVFGAAVLLVPAAWEYALSDAQKAAVSATLGKLAPWARRRRQQQQLLLAKQQDSSRWTDLPAVSAGASSSSGGGGGGDPLTGARDTTSKGVGAVPSLKHVA
jgi:hypothetical protein